MSFPFYNSVNGVVISILDTIFVQFALFKDLRQMIADDKNDASHQSLAPRTSTNS